MSVARSRSLASLDQALGLELLQPRVVEPPPVNGFEPLLIDAFGEAQAHQKIFVGRVLRAQALVLLDAVARGGDRFEPGFRRLSDGDGMFGVRLA